MNRQEAKDLFKNDVDSYGKPRKIMTKIDKIFDDFDIERPLKRGGVDLSKCKPGDILISAHGDILKYISPAEETNYYDHKVEYIDPQKGNGSRTNDGYVFRQNRIPETDHDIILVIPKCLIKTLL
jgi:hypothetical protein